MKILFVGSGYGNSLLTFKCIKSIHKNTKFLNTDSILENKFQKILYNKLYPQLFEKRINNFYNNYINESFDLIFFYNCQFITKNIIFSLKKNKSKIFFYCADNPFVNRDKKRWFFIKKIIKYFDLVIFQQKNREQYVKKFKIKNFITILPPYFKKHHFKKSLKNPPKKIIFLGTWYPERGIFFYNLKKKGLNFDIHGTHWQKDKKYYKYLKSNINLKPLSANQVSKKINKYKIAIALYSKDNKDDLSNRTIEIPVAGSLICSQKTNTMTKILKENKEAIYFKDYKDCYTKCKYLLNNKKKIDEIRKNSRNKIIKIYRPEAVNIYTKILNFKNLYKKDYSFVLN